MPAPLPPSPHDAPCKAGEFRWSMGLEPLDLHDGIEVDERGPVALAEKDRRPSERHGAVFGALPEAHAGAAEVLALLIEHLPARFPDVHRREGDVMAPLAGGGRWRLGEGPLPPRDLAGRLVQEALCLMQEDGESGLSRLVGASLCVPTGWSLADKMGRSVGAIHAPLPHDDRQLGSTTDRYFARIKVERPVWRLPRGHIPRDSRVGITADHAGDRLWLRVERQTLRRLPRSGDILFTIRIHVRPLRDVRKRAGEVARLAAAVRAVPPEVARYKGCPPPATRRSAGWRRPTRKRPPGRGAPSLDRRPAPMTQHASRSRRRAGLAAPCGMPHPRRVLDLFGVHHRPRLVDPNLQRRRDSPRSRGRRRASG